MTATIFRPLRPMFMNMFSGLLATLSVVLITSDTHAEDQVERFENGLYEQPVMSVAHISHPNDL